MGWGSRLPAPPDRHNAEAQEGEALAGDLRGDPSLFPGHLETGEGIQRGSIKLRCPSGRRLAGTAAAPREEGLSNIQKEA